MCYTRQLGIISIVEVELRAQSSRLTDPYWNTLTGGNQVVNNSNPVTAAAGALVINED